MSVKRSDFLLPTFLLLFGMVLLIMSISREGLNGAMTLSIGMGALGSFGIWLLTRRATHKRDLMYKNPPHIPQNASIGPVLILTVILISIGNGIIRFSLDVNGQTVVAAFISTFLVGASLSQFWELWYEWRRQRSRHYQ